MPSTENWWTPDIDWSAPADQLLQQFLATLATDPLERIGLSTIPHTQSSEMRYRRDPDPQLGARVQLFLCNRSTQSLDFDPARRAVDLQTSRAILGAAR